jgi:chromosomal replication initiation ATPase DnaA
MLTINDIIKKYENRTVYRQIVNDLKNYIRPNTDLKRRFTELCNILEIDRDSMLERNRRNKVVRPRHVLIYILWNEGYTSTDIGTLLNLDHSTILHGRNRVDFDKDYDIIIKKYLGIYENNKKQSEAKDN